VRGIEETAEKFTIGTKSEEVKTTTMHNVQTFAKALQYLRCASIVYFEFYTHTHIHRASCALQLAIICQHKDQGQGENEIGLASVEH
jgi:hypothetical protein